MSTASAIPISTRCSHRTPSGRRCSTPAADSKSGLCARHLRVHKEADSADLSRFLLAGWEGFQTAQGVNHTLGNLYLLLAENRISARRAAVLAYISSLVLRTHPSIDADRENGIEAPEASAGEPAPNDEPSRQTLAQQAADRARAPFDFLHRESAPQAPPPASSTPMTPEAIANYERLRS
jgi:hypothetical protein